MSIHNPGLGWEKLQDVYYRIRELRALEWDKDISPYIVAISSYGTSIAMFPKPSFYNDNLIKSIEVFTGSGVPIFSIPWLNSNGNIISLGWSVEDESLIVILEQGIVRYYYNFEGDFNEIDLKLSRDQLVRETKFFDKGCVMALSDGNFVLLRSYNKPIVRQIECDSIKMPSGGYDGWAIVPPKLNQSLQVYVSSQGDIFSIGVDSNHEIQTEDRIPFNLATVSPNGDFIACFEKRNNVLTILTADFQHKLSTFTSDNSSMAYDLKWCANDAVILAHQNEIKLVGPSDDSISHYYSKPPILFTESDGLRVLSNQKVEFLSRVSDQTISTFKLGSTTASAILLDAIDQFDNRSPKVHENLNIIRGSLVEAIDDCVNAATEEFDPYWQQKLLRAASFGKSSLEAYDPESFIEACNDLKILNNLRNPEVGMYLTHQEYLNIGIDNLMARLLKRKQYKFARQLADVVKCPVAPIYTHWASSEIKRSKNVKDEEILANVMKKLHSVKNVSFSELSLAAFEEGRTKLSIALLNYEAIPEKQIPLLLEMQQDNIALLKAETSGDVDILYYVLSFMQNKLQLADFFRLINDKDIAVGIFKVLNKDTYELMKNLHHQLDNDLEICNMDISHHYARREDKKVALNELYQKIEQERKLLVMSLRKYDQYSHLGQEARLIESQIKLLNVQEKLSKEFEMDFYTSCHSLNSLVARLISINQIGKVDKLLSREFNMNEKKIAYLVVDTLISQKNFSKLFELAKSSRSSIGYEYHFRQLVRAKEDRQASLYVDMCHATYEKKMKMLLKCHDYKKASDEAFKKRDIQALKLIHQKGNSVAKRVARGYLDQLGAAP